MNEKKVEVSVSEDTKSPTAPNQFIAGIVGFDDIMVLRCLGLMISLPFLVPYHQPPIASFYSEWLAILYGLIAVLLCGLLYLKESVLIPRITTMPLALMVVVLLQWQLGMFSYQASAIGILFFLFWSVLLMVAGATLVEKLGASKVIAYLAWFVCWGGVANALIGWVQYFHIWSLFGGWVNAPSDLSAHGISGNLAQQNHYVTHLSLALLSATYLALIGEKPVFRYVLSAAILLVAMFLSAARSGLIYLVLLMFLMLLLADFKQNRKQVMRWIGGGICLALLATVLLGWAVHQGFKGPQIERWLNMHGAFGPRLYLWKHALIMFFNHPLMGVGFDDYSAYLLNQVAAMREPVVWGIDRSAHNIFLHLLAVAGIVGGLAFSVPLALFCREQCRHTFTPNRAWLLGVLGILLIHSMLEQPLFYAYFLGLAALAAGAADFSSWQVRASKYAQYGVISVLMMAIGILFMSGRDYLDFTKLQKRLSANGTFEGADGDKYRKRIIELQRFSFLSPYVELNFPLFFIDASTTPKEKLAFNTRVLRYSPVPEIEIRQSYLLFEDGQLDASTQYFSRVAYIYPDKARQFYAQLLEHSKDNPAVNQKWLEAIGKTFSESSPNTPGSESHAPGS